MLTSLCINSKTQKSLRSYKTYFSRKRRCEKKKIFFHQRAKHPLPPISESQNLQGGCLARNRRYTFFTLHTLKQVIHNYTLYTLHTTHYTHKNRKYLTTHTTHFTHYTLHSTHYTQKNKNIPTTHSTQSTQYTVHTTHYTVHTKLHTTH